MTLLCSRTLLAKVEYVGAHLDRPLVVGSPLQDFRRAAVVAFRRLDGIDCSARMLFSVPGTIGLEKVRSVA